MAKSSKPVNLDIDKLQDEFDDLSISIKKLRDQYKKNIKEEISYTYKDKKTNQNVTVKKEIGRASEKDIRGRLTELSKSPTLTMDERREKSLLNVMASKFDEQQKLNDIAKRGKNKPKLKQKSATELNRIQENKENERYLKEKNGWNKFQNSWKNPKKGGKAAAISMLTDAVGKTLDAAGDIYIAQQKKEQAQWMANQDIYLKTLETGGKIFQRNVKAFGKGMQGAISSTFSSITQGVQEGSYAAANASIDYGTEMFKNQLDNDLDRMKLSFYKSQRQSEADLEKLKLTNQQINSGVGAANGLIQTFGGPIAGAVSGLVTSIVGTVTKMAEAQSEIRYEKLKKELEVKEKELELIKEAKQTAIDQAHDATQKVIEFGKSIETLSTKTEDLAKKLSNIGGLNALNAEDYTRFIYGAQRNLRVSDGKGNSKYFDKNSEDMFKVQNQYIETSERNILMNNEEYNKTFALGKVVGDDNLAASMLGDMDYFNHTIEDSTNMIFDMYQEANRAGVSNRKFAKELQQNLKLAQKYTFKGGVKGMMEMSIWAQKTRFNMNALDGMLDRISEGGLEGVITQAAQLQVTGGAGAMGADPIAMMFERYNDPGALAKRYNSMLNGLGTFNSQTGEVDITGTNAMLLEARAKAMGMSVEDARAQVTQKIKSDQIDRNLKAKYTDEQKALLYNKAQYDKSDGKWKVNVMRKNAEGKMEMQKVDVNNVASDEFEQLMPHEETIESYVIKIFSLLESQQGQTNKSQADLQDETYENLKKNIEQRIQDLSDFMDTNGSKLVEELKQVNDFVTGQAHQQYVNMVATQDILEKEFDIMRQTAEDFSKNLSDGTSLISNSLESLRLTLELNRKKIELNSTTDEGKKSSILKEIAELEQQLDVVDTNIKNQAVGETKTNGYNSDWADYAWAADAQDNGLKEWLRDTSENSEELSGHGISFVKAANAKNYHEAWESLSDLAGLGFWHSEDEGYDASMTYGQLLDAMEKLYREGYVDENGMRLREKKNVTSNDIAESTYLKELNKFREQYSEILGTNIKNREFDGKSIGNGSEFSSVFSNLTKGSQVQDGIMQSNGIPMITQATKVTPVHDGSVRFAQADPDDTALFAKDGGPFDVLFHDIFGRIDSLYSYITNGVQSGKETIIAPNVLPSSEEMFPVSSPYSYITNGVQSGKETITKSQSSTINFGTVKIEMNGKLELSSGGKSIDIINEIKNNPQLLRQLSQMISDEVSKNINGGKSLYSGGQIVGNIRN